MTMLPFYVCLNPPRRSRLIGKPEPRLNSPLMSDYNEAWRQKPLVIPTHCIYYLLEVAQL